MIKEKAVEKPLNIYQRMNAVMEEVDYIQKKEGKSDTLKYTFVSHDRVTSKMHPMMVKHGICVVCSVENYTNTLIETKKSNSQGTTIIPNVRTEVLLNVKFVNIDNPSDFIEVKAIGFGFDPSDKGAGKAISYAFKYAILKNFMLETGDDPDEDQDTVLAPQFENKKVEQIENPLAFISADQCEELNILLMQCDDLDISAIKTRMTNKEINDDFTNLPIDSFEVTKRLLLGKIKNKQKNFSNGKQFLQEKAS